MSFSPAIVVPVYNHEQAIGATVARLKPHGLPCWLVDDGSSPVCAATLDALARDEADWLHLLRLPQNAGKGVAALAGFEAAAAAGHSHAVQIDADGQHDAADLPALLAAARDQPQALVSGLPQFDASIPSARYYGRWLTHVLVWVETLSLEIRDSMCGFRVYPLAATLALMRRGRYGQRMDFDTDVMVRLHWSGVPVIGVPTRVTYPADGVSHFHYLRDNLRMIRLHLRLLAGMLLRSPRLLARRLRR